MIKQIFTILALTMATPNAFAAILGDCTTQRFSREMEYLLMKQCMDTYNFMDKNQFKEKLEACSCYIGSLACEFNGSDKKLIKNAEAGKKLENNDKKYSRCSEKKSEKDHSTMKGAAKKAINDAD